MGQRLSLGHAGQPGSRGVELRNAHPAQVPELVCARGRHPLAAQSLSRRPRPSGISGLEPDPRRHGPCPRAIRRARICRVGPQKEAGRLSPMPAEPDIPSAPPAPVSAHPDCAGIWPDYPTAAAPYPAAIPSPVTRRPHIIRAWGHGHDLNLRRRGRLGHDAHTAGSGRRRCRRWGRRARRRIGS